MIDTSSLSEKLTELCGYNVEVFTAPKADSLFICSLDSVTASKAVGKLVGLLNISSVELIEHGSDDWGYYYRIAVPKHAEINPIRKRQKRVEGSFVFKGEYILSDGMTKVEDRITKTEQIRQEKS